MDYSGLCDFVNRMQREGVTVGYLGQSGQGRMSPYLRLGGGGKRVVAVYAGHAREHITAQLACAHADYYARRMERFYPEFTLDIVPMLDPDGVELCCHGLQSVVDTAQRERLLEWNGGSDDFSLWKADAEGVDLNVNFDAGWGMGFLNRFEPGPENYVGDRPLSQNESRALLDFIETPDIVGTLSFHAKGEVIYWHFFQEEERLLRDLRIADHVSRSCGYPLREAPGSFGGYKDYCISMLKLPSLTVEVGSDALEHPIGPGQFGAIWQRTRIIPAAFLEGIRRELNRG